MNLLNIVKKKGQSNLIDEHVGNRIKLRRSILGMSQKALADAAGITFQQIQKYENGENRVGASRLYDLSRILNVPITFFFEDIDKEKAEQSPRMLKLTPSRKYALAEDNMVMDTDPMHRQETLTLVNAYYKIRDRQVAKKLLDMIVRMSEKADADVSDIVSSEKK